MIRKLVWAAIFFILTTGNIRAQHLALNLGGKNAGCPMNLVYDPAILKVAPKVAETFAKPDLDEYIELEGLKGIGSFKERKTGRVWYLYSSGGLSCDPYFLFMSATKDKEKVTIGGESLRFVGASDFTVSAGLNLYFEIERRFSWEGGKPVEKKPDYYPVSRDTKSMKELALTPDKAGAAPESLPAGIKLSVIGYKPAEKLALVKTITGKRGWIVLDNESLAGVSFQGD